MQWGLLENLNNSAHISVMEHIICKKCKSEYDLTPVMWRGGGFVPHDTTCEVCRSVLKDWENDRDTIAIMTKRGLVITR